MESSQKFRTNFSEWFGYWALELLENQFARVNPVLIYENPCEIPWKLLTTIKSERHVFMMFVLRIVIIIAKVKSSITTCFDTPCISLSAIRFKSRSNRVYLFVTHNGNRKRNPFAKWKAVNFLSTFSQTGRFTRYTFYQFQYQGQYLRVYEIDKTTLRSELYEWRAYLIFHKTLHRTFRLNSQRNFPSGLFSQWKLSLNFMKRFLAANNRWFFFVLLFLICQFVLRAIHVHFYEC